ncbi:hypothetical protein [Acetobacterium sp. MES1]|nr:hypothetical protein [Acetobacterium sp. MES1]
MKTILVIELIALYGIFIVGALLWVIKDINDAIKKANKGKEKL